MAQNLDYKLLSIIVVTLYLQLNACQLVSCFTKVYFVTIGTGSCPVTVDAKL